METRMQTVARLRRRRLKGSFRSARLDPMTPTTTMDATHDTRLTISWKKVR
jgi:hypothetical protein